MRVLLAIGVNAYDHENPLTGAEGDAERVFKALMRPEIGDYDAGRSRLLISPTVAAVRATLQEVLFADGPIDTFTFFFAGHGAVEAGSFYMLPKDSPTRGLSIGALSLADLFRAINEAAPAQSNIIIDACQAGGLIADLGVLLKPDLIGNSGTPGVTLVATAAQDQAALETGAGGLGTNALLDVIEGRDVLNETAEAFDLAEIGRRVSTRLRTEAGQTPVVWGLNLYGPPRFCRNLRASSDPSRPLHEVLRAWPAGSDVQIRQRFNDLWRIYISVNDDWAPRRFANVVDPLLASLAADPHAQAAVVERLAAACLERARLSQDAFRPAQVGAALVACLLPYLAAAPVAEQAAALVEEIGGELIAAGHEMSAVLDADRYALLTRDGTGMPDLFLLPIRLANILGWLAAATMIFPDGADRHKEAVFVFGNLIDRIIEHYSTSILAISEIQAAPFAIALSQAMALGLTEQAEVLTSAMFADLTTRKAHMAADAIPPASLFAFLDARAKGDYGAVQSFVARPEELTPVVLLAGARLGLDEVFDALLWEIDGHAFNIYLTDAWASFGAEQMTEGQNLMWTIGETVFLLKDLDPASVAPVAAPPDAITILAVILAALTYPDRTPWFLLTGAPEKNT